MIFFEHEWVRIDTPNERGLALSEQLYSALAAFHEKAGRHYYSLIHNGVKFKHFVGVLQVGNEVIEVLPKVDQYTKLNDSVWRDVLIDMLRISGKIRVKQAGAAAQNLKRNSLLDLLFENFISSVEELLHTGIIKKYQTVQQNSKALRGSLAFSKHISQNLVHKERFYINNTSYNTNHTINRILYEALLVLKSINKASDLKSRIGYLLLNFPECSPVQVSESLFNKIVLNRKSRGYGNALLVAKLILLRLMPDLKSGKANVIALMFDMNELWESYILKSLQSVETKEGFPLEITGQVAEEFWNGRYVRSDIYIQAGSLNYIIDTKWKVIDAGEPAISDIQQMYIYNHHYKSAKSLLLYPKAKSNQKFFSKPYILRNLFLSDTTEHFCELAFVDVLNGDRLNFDIGIEILEILGLRP